MKCSISVVVVFSLLLSAVPILRAAEKAPGPAIGKKAPVFKLKDQKGKEQSLQELLKKRNVALVFYRSADW